MIPSTCRRAGFILALALARLVASPPAYAAETYAYDPIGRLTDAAYANGGSLHYTYDANGNILSIVTSLATAVGDASAPLQFALGPTTPNPGSGSRSVAFTIPARGHVTLRVFDVSGREVATLNNRVLDPGHYNAQFSTGRWGNGVYFYRLETAGRVRSGPDGGPPLRRLAPDRGLGGESCRDGETPRRPGAEAYANQLDPPGPTAPARGLGAPRHGSEARPRDLARGRARVQPPGATLRSVPN